MIKKRRVPLTCSKKKNNSRFLSNLQIIVKEVDIVINSELLSFFFNLFISRVRLIKKN